MPAVLELSSARRSYTRNYAYTRNYERSSKTYSNPDAGKYAMYSSSV